jgi:hypothetical protein
MEKDKEWELQPICKLCHYRRPLYKVLSRKTSTYWGYTACFYLNDTGERRDGQPQGDYCPNFKLRED